LGDLYKDQGKMAEAEKMYERALDGKEKAWGPEHTSTLDTVNNLGLLYTDQGKLVEAEKMYQRETNSRAKIEHGGQYLVGGSTNSTQISSHKRLPITFTPLAI